LQNFKNAAYQKSANKDIIGIAVRQSDGNNTPKQIRDTVTKLIDENFTRSAYLEPGTSKFDGTEGAFIMHKSTC
jgi:hypothetical protein